MAMNEIAIEVKNLIKRYGEGETALCGVSFAVPRGALFAYLGVNGAGKSTTINILCSVLGKTGGEVRILGLNPDRNSAEIKRKTGIVFQSSVLDERDPRGVLRTARKSVEIPTPGTKRPTRPRPHNEQTA